MEKQLQSERWLLIMDIIRTEKTVRVEDLSNRLNVSENTIRRDLNMLAHKGMVERTKGGALSRMEGISEKSFSSREARNRDGKELIAEKAAEMIKKGDTVILDGGTTAVRLAERIAEMEHITVLTNSIDVAAILSEAQGITLVLSGGIYNSDSRTLTGLPAEKFFKDVNADKLFLAVTGISPEQGLSDQNMFETQVKLVMLDKAAEVIVLADKSKFGRSAFSPICDFSQVDKIICDTLPENISPSSFKEKGVEVLICLKK